MTAFNQANVSSSIRCCFADAASIAGTDRPICAPDGTLLGRDHDGGFAEYVAAPAANIHALPEGVNHREASLIQVLTTCLHAQRLVPCCVDGMEMPWTAAA